MSVQFIDPWKFIYDLNEYRLRKGLRYLTCSEFITSLTKRHCLDLIQNEVQFNLANSEIRRNKLSPCVKTCQEILARSQEDKNLLEILLADTNTKQILEGNYQLFGITIFQIGVMVHMHLILAEPY